MLLSLIIVFWASTGGANASLMEVKTNAGDFVGERVNNVEFGGNNRSGIRFLGIPFAKPPIGSRRFKRPEAPDKHPGLYNATYFRPHCAQSVADMPFIANFKRDEDCLYLNLYIPGGQLSKDNRFPVMIWIYGGSFRSGGADIYSGEILSAFNDVIVVTFNYRVNVFGFLSDGSKSSGNFGLWDQQMAIEWVHTNIGNFGGDSSNVTLFGESAGGASVIFHGLRDNSRNLFHRLIAQSGSALAPWALQRSPSTTFTKFAKRAGCVTRSSESTIQCLRGKTVPELLSYVDSLNPFTPVIDDDFVKNEPALLFENQTESSALSLATFSDLDLLIGVNSEDGAYAISTVWVAVLQRMSVDINRGVPKSIFDTLYVKGMLHNIMGITDPLIQKATVYTYTDWTNEHDTIKVRNNMVNMASDILFFVPAVRTASQHSDITLKSTYFYEFDHKPWFDNQHAWIQGASHTVEIVYVFGLPETMKIVAGIPKDVPIPRPADEVRLSRLIMKMWTNFAKTGNPNSAELVKQGNPAWPVYGSDNQPYFRFSLNITSESIQHRLAAPRVKFWTDLVPDLQAKCSKPTETEIVNKGVSLICSTATMLYAVFASWISWL